MFKTAEEYRKFGLIFSLHLLEDILPKIYFEHYKKLILGLRTIMKKSLSKEEAKKAQRKLKKFVDKMPVCINSKSGKQCT